MATRDPSLELAQARDAHAIAVMSRDLIEAGLGWEYQPDRVARMLADPGMLSVVARDGGRTAGFAMMSFGDERAHLALLAVAPHHQRCGVGRRLLDWQVESAQVAGVVSVNVELRADNAAAFALYASAGFTETIRVPGYYRARETAIRMIRVLRDPGLAVPGWQPPTRDRS